MKPYRPPPRSACALCLAPAKLSNSHIIPKFAYKQTMEGSGYALIKSTEDGVPTYKVQRSWTERLLCPACETRISVWERYANRVLNGQEGERTDVEDVGTTIVGLDYQKFKLFQMSVLWRASITTNPFFKYVNLGPREEPLRLKLLAGDAGAPEEYGCWMISLVLPEIDVRAVVLEPQSRRWDHLRMVQFTFSGFNWVFMVSARYKEAMSKGLLQTNGTMHILKKPLFDVPGFTDMFARMAQKDLRQQFKF
jgi:hypothetical protein